MRKNIRVTSLTSAAVAALFLMSPALNNNQVVKADTNKNNDATTAKAKSPEESAKENVQSAQSEVDKTQKEVEKATTDRDKAKNDADQKNKDYNDKLENAKKAQANQDAKENAQQSAQSEKDAAQKLADQANDANVVKKANDDVAAQQNKIDKANNEKSKADQAVNGNQDKIDQDQSLVDENNSNVADKTTAKNNADQATKDAKDVLDGVGITDAQNAQQSAQGVVNKDISDKQAADQLVSDKSAAEENAENDLGNAEEAAEQASDDARLAKENQAEAANAQQSAQQDVDSKQAEINDLTDQYNKVRDLSANTITFGGQQNIDTWKQALIDYESGKSIDKYADFFRGLRESNKYISNVSDLNNQVDINNLTDDQLTDLSLYVADLISKMRNQLGWSSDRVSKGSLQFARDVAQRYLDDKWDTSWHDAQGINDVSQEDGLDFNNKSDSNEEQYYEDAMMVSRPTEKTTMDELKGQFYEDLIIMMFPNGHGLDKKGGNLKYEMGHARGIIDGEITNNKELAPVGTTDIESYTNAINRVQDNLNQWINAKNGYQSQDLIDQAQQEIDRDQNIISSYTKILNKLKDGIENGQYISAIPTNVETAKNVPFFRHILGINPSNIKDSSSLSTEVIPSYADQLADLADQIETESNNLSSLNETLDNANQELEDANNALKEARAQKRATGRAQRKAQTKLAQAQQELEDAQNQQANINNKLAEDQATLDAANDKLSKLQASHEEKVRLYNEALANQMQANNDLQQAQQALNTAKAQLEADQKVQENLVQTAQQKANDLKKAQNDLKPLQEFVESLRTAPQRLADATQKLTDAQQAFNSAKEANDAAQQAVSDAKNAKDTSDAKLQQAETKLTETKQALQTAQAKLTQAQQVLYDIQHPNIEIDNAAEISNDKFNANGNKTISENNNQVSGEDHTAHVSNNKIVLTHNAYVYNSKGKTVKHNGKKILLRKKAVVNTVNHKKVVYIKGKAFYQIGRNKFVKVANTLSKASKVKMHVIGKGKHHKRIRLYNSKGKATRKYIVAGHRYRVSRKKTINGKVFYKLYGKNEWVLAKSVLVRR